MTAALLAFDRTRRSIAMLSHDGIRCRARTTARITGCCYAEIRAVDSQAADMLLAGEPNHDVIERCRTLARALVDQRAKRHPA